MIGKKLENLACGLNDMSSLQKLFAELNFDWANMPVSKDSWDKEQKEMVGKAKVIARKNDYQIYYIQTNTDSIKKWQGIASRIIKNNHGLCMVCSHNPDGFKWIFSSLSRDFSKSFSETRHIPIEIRSNADVPKTFIEFLEKIRVSKDQTATSIMSKVSDAFDSFAIQIHDELTVNVFEALKTLSEGIILDKSNSLTMNESTLEKIREPTFILLYRIMFVLYAEDRSVFPDSEFYYDNFSLKWIKRKWILSDATKIDKYEIWERLKKLFQLIEVGSEEMEYKREKFFMRSYYGRLFDRRIHSQLEEWNIPSKNLLEAIGLLTRTHDKKGNYFFLDYAALETRHLGAIYERLLEFHLTARDGKVADLPDSKERKSTGSYYTPKYIVDYIVENTVGPLIDEIIKNTQDSGEQVDRILELNVLDPAMGSGHFLVGATNYIAKRICQIECKGEIIESVLIERKRDVARRCIYGVDINPLAVDLAHVSLWLETLSSEKPLSFLSAHLKSGNSLIGSSINDMLDRQTTLMETSVGRAQFKKNVRDFILLEMLDDDTAEAVRTKTIKYRNMQSKGTIYYNLKFLLDAKVAKDFGVDVPPIGDFVAKIGENNLEFFQEGSTWPEVQKTAEEHQFFHWDLEFPDIFYEENGKRKKNAGFDTVIGNPPYGAKLAKIEQEYYKNMYLEVNSTDTAQLMIFSALRSLSKYGNHGFIVPKALVFASNWKNIREKLLNDLTILIDCKKVWGDVKLEQIVYVYRKNSGSLSYATGSRMSHILIADDIICKKLCDRFGFFLCGINQEEILLGWKIYEKSEMLSKYIHNSRGCMLQRKVKEKGDNKVLGGSQIQRYYITPDVKGYLDSKDIDSSKAHVNHESILVQRIVAHIKNPVDHIKITATIPHDTNFVILDTISQIVTDCVNPYYVLGFLNSKLANWYAYRFVFAKAIRTMQFDNPTTNKIPIIIKKEKEVVAKVKKLIQHMDKISKRSSEYSTTDISKNIINLTDEINQLFYVIFNLTDREIDLIKSSTVD